MKKLTKYTLAVAVLLGTGYAQAQTITLQQAVQSALENNNLLKIKQWQVTEQEAKVNESRIKLFPVVTVNGAYQYNVETGELVIPAGTFGALPLNPTTVVPLPGSDEVFPLSKHNIVNVGAMAYQPITQLGKIKTGIEVAKTDQAISRLEQTKAEQQITNAVEQYYYGILAIRKRKTEAKKNREVAQLKLYDVQSALMAGKTTDVSEYGLKANIAHEEQELLKLQFQEEDYLAEFRKLTGISVENPELAEVPLTMVAAQTLDDYQSQALKNNTELQIIGLQKLKSDLGIQAARQSYLPEVGIFAGYTYQEGNIIMPKSNPYAGVNLKWNIQDIFSNRQVIAQRQALRQQAEENEKYMTEQTTVATSKAYRKMKQAEELIRVAQQAVDYRKQELKEETDRLETGLGKPLKVRETEAALAKAEADLYGAIISYKIARSELGLLTNTGE